MIGVIVLVLSQVPHYAIEEIERDGVFVSLTSGLERVQGAPRFAGKQGWSFDADSKCRVVMVAAGAAGRRREDPGEARLMLLPRLSVDAGVVIATSPLGYSSPALSPDGAQFVVVRGANELVKIELKETGMPDAGATVLGTAWFAFWGLDGNITAYEHVGKDCHMWRRLSPSGVVLRERRHCGGYSGAAIGAGVAPTDAPVPILDERGTVVALLGNDVSVHPSNVRISTAERGFACSAGVDFVSDQGGSLTLSVLAGEWGVRPGQSCSVPLERRRGRVKTVKCP